MYKNLRGHDDKKIAIVTGGSRGIGKAIVKALAEMKNFIVVVDYNQTNAQIMQSELFEQGISIDIFKADISKQKDIDALVDYTLNKYGRIDILVNNAGVSCYKLTQDVTKADWDRVVGTNLFGTFAMCQRVIDSMVDNHCGCIINISSIWGLVGASMESLYSLTKGGINAFTKSLAKELAPSGIRVNAIAPGMIMTDMNSDWSDEELEQIKEEIPLGRFGQPEDVAQCVKWLVADNYTTGQIISPNGGWVI